MMMMMQALTRLLRTIVATKTKSEGTGHHQHKELGCDYLVVGAGAASLAFVDTLLAEMPDQGIVLVDKHEAPGGHWNDAYDFVRLHQPSIVYGVSSRQLEGNWLWGLLTRFTLPWHHRATKQEILEYYASAVQGWIEQGKVRYYPSCVFDFVHAKEHPSGPYRFSSLDGTEEYSIAVRRKVVDGTKGEPLVPSTHPISFPVDKGVEVLTPNDLPKLARAGARDRQLESRNYVVLGCGKTGMDTCVYLQETLGIDPKNITWIVSEEPYMMSRSKVHPFTYHKAVLEADGDRSKALRGMEEKGRVFTLFERSSNATVFRFAIISREELILLRRITGVVRRGRVVAIEKGDRGGLSICFRDGCEIIQGDVCVVHCCSPGPFNGGGYDGGRGKVFATPRLLRLGLLLSPPICASMSMLAMLEACLSKKLLDESFARKLMGTEDEKVCGGEELLSHLITPFAIAKTECALSQLQPIVNLAIFIGVCKQDPLEVLRWLKCNRLCFYSIPNFRSGIVSSLKTMQMKKATLGITKEQDRVLALLVSKLGPYEDQL